MILHQHIASQNFKSTRRDLGLFVPSVKSQDNVLFEYHCERIKTSLWFSITKSDNDWGCFFKKIQNNMGKNLFLVFLFAWIFFPFTEKIYFDWNWRVTIFPLQKKKLKLPITEFTTNYYLVFYLALCNNIPFNVLQASKSLTLMFKNLFTIVSWTINPLLFFPRARHQCDWGI